MQEIAVIFDLDGTLVDSAPDLLAALNHALTVAGRPAVSLDELRHMVGRGARILLERALTATGGMPHEAEFEAMVNAFFAYYGAHLSDNTRPFEGVRETLETLKQRGALMGVCTNKPMQFAKPLLEDLGLAPYFSAIVGADSFPYRKPDPRHLTGTIDAMGAGGRQAVMVGDSIHDIAAAKDASIPVIAVSFGYTETPVSELDPDHIIDDFRELPKVLEKIARGETARAAQ